MEIKQLLTEDRAVSPVIGVILMVAITVILAAVIGTFVLGLGQNVQSTPQAQFSFDFKGSGGSYNATIAHEGGDTLTTNNAAHINVTASSADTQDWLADASKINAGTTCSFGDGSNCTSDGAAANINAGETVRIVWIGSNGDSQTIATQTAPN